MEWTAFEIDCSGLAISGFYAIEGDMLQVSAGEFGSKTMRLHSVSHDIALKVLVREIVRAWTHKRSAKAARQSSVNTIHQAAA